MDEERLQLEADYRRARWLLDVWDRGDPPPWLIWLSRIYRSVSSTRRDFYLSRRSPADGSGKVVGVGNLTVGGSGKTPLVTEIALAGLARDLRVAVVVGTAPGGLDPAGDEYHLLNAVLGEAEVRVAGNKDKAARNLAEDYDLVVIDDALQVFSLEKDLELVVLSEHTATDGEPHLLPAGPYRELPGALERADTLVFNGKDPGEDRAGWLDGYSGTTLSMSYRPLEGLTFRRAFQHLVIGNYHQLRSNLRTFNVSDRPRDVVAFAGIAHPMSFFRSLTELMQENIIHGYAFPDHFHYQRLNISELRDAGAGRLVYTTEKDFFRIVAENGGLEDDPPAEWYDLLQQVGHWQFIPVEAELSEALELPF